MIQRVLLAVLVLLTASASPAMGQGAAPAEKAVRGAIEDFVRAQNAGDLDGFLVYLSEDAKIDSTVAGGKVGKAEYAAAMKRWWDVPANKEFKSETKIEKVSFPSATRAVVETQGIAYRKGSFTNAAWNQARRIEWKLEERDGKWLIVETTLLKK
jgi:uncharacterized protein (TIGR02246 family)